jgi:hypothetical protein
MGADNLQRGRNCQRMARMWHETSILMTDKLTWMAIDISPDRKHLQLCGGAEIRIMSQFVVKLSAHMGKLNPAR